MSRSVLFLAPSAYTLGGLATWLDYLVPGLRHAGWDARVALTQGRFHDVERYLAAHDIGPAIAVSCGSGTREGRIRSLARAFRTSHPDIVAFTNIPDAGLAAARLRRRGAWSGRAVMVIHGIQQDLFRDVARLREGLDAVVCTNRLACALAVSLGGMPPERVLYAPYGTEPPEDAPEPSRAGGQAPIRLGFVGRLEQPQKRVRDLPTLLERLRERGVDFELIVAGSGPEEDWLREHLPRAAPGRVQMLGRVPQADLEQRFYNQVDAVLITSSWETGPIVAWEAMAFGVPVLTSRYVGSGLEGNLEHGRNCLLFPIGDMPAAAECVQAVRDREVRAALLRGGFELVRNQYSREASVRGWAECLERISDLPPLPDERAGRDDQPERAAGRLDRLLGAGLAETVRSALAIRYRHASPGGEWPHTLNGAGEGDEEFWALAAKLDASARVTG